METYNEVRHFIWKIKTTLSLMKMTRHHNNRWLLIHLSLYSYKFSWETDVLVMLAVKQRSKEEWRGRGMFKSQYILQLCQWKFLHQLPERRHFNGRAIKNVKTTKENGFLQLCARLKLLRFTSRAKLRLPHIFNIPTHQHLNKPEKNTVPPPLRCLPTPLDIQNQYRAWTSFFFTNHWLK